jgi:hypothetical protein
VSRFDIVQTNTESLKANKNRILTPACCTSAGFLTKMDETHEKVVEKEIQ